MNHEPSRFTLDGNPGLEKHLAFTCARVCRAVQEVVPTRRLEALVLGGGYGRGQGGVCRTEAGDRPYNDMEFYVFVRGVRWANDLRYRDTLRTLAERLSPEAEVHLEFKVDSLQRLRRGPVSMFSYDLVTGHRRLLGDQDIFEGCERHRDAANIPTSEAMRLLLNRCTGLLLAKELLYKRSLTVPDSDFIGRNLAKAQLALGDTLLTAFGQYHWSCLERHDRLNRLVVPQTFKWLDRVRQAHESGVDFKLHPRRCVRPAKQLQLEHRELTALALDLWLWLESRRLETVFGSLRDYALSRLPKCHETRPWRNYLITLRTFGPPAAFEPLAWRYPRERLLHALPLLLANDEVSNQPELTRHLQRQLHTTASDWRGLVEAYKRIWPSYG